MKSGQRRRHSSHGEEEPKARFKNVHGSACAGGGGVFGGGGGGPRLCLYHHPASLVGLAKNGKASLKARRPRLMKFAASSDPLT